MDISFVRHGHAEHLLDYPHRLNTTHPGLTPQGKRQVEHLRTGCSIGPNDAILISPTKRTLETALILAGSNHPGMIVTPIVGPRMFPQHPEYSFLACDRIYSREEVSRAVPQAYIWDGEMDCWEDGEGINRMEQKRFEAQASRLLEWVREKADRAWIISHDGTITHYRLLLGEQGLSRQDFLGEAGMHTINM